MRDFGLASGRISLHSRQTHFVQASTATASPPGSVALDNARRKAYWRLLPLLFVCYVIAFVDRTNVAIAKLTMTRDLPGFDNAVIGFGFGMLLSAAILFFLGIGGKMKSDPYSAKTRGRAQ